MALSIVEFGYVVVASYCAQFLWIKKQLKDFEIVSNTIPLFCDNTNALNMAKNPMQHKKTKDINVRCHFLRDNMEKGSYA